jgi:hypothetical protein
LIKFRECLLLFSPKSFVFPSYIKNLNIKIYKTVILPVVLYGCETWSLTLGEEHRLRVFENRVLRKTFLYSSPNIVRVIKSRRMRWAGHVARMGRGDVFTGFWLGGPKGRDHWEDLGVGVRITLKWTFGR